MVARTLDRTFSAIADPTRRAILSRLAQGEASVSELAEPFDMTMPAVSKHLKVLERAGLIERGRDAQRRPCRLRAEPLREASGWIEQYRTMWNDRLDRLDAYLRDQKTSGAVRGAVTRAKPAGVGRVRRGKDTTP
jgi:DNA-binding transcriptional ArsR family regulator